MNKLLLYDNFVKLYFKLPNTLKMIVANCIYKPCVHKTAILFGYVTISKNVKIGAYTYVCENSILSNVSIGKYCCIAKKVAIVDGMHPYTSFSNYSFFNHVGSPLRCMKKKELLNGDNGEKHTEIGNDVWIGESVSIKGGVSIGNGSVIGTKSMVTKDVPPYAIVAGNPAKVIKYRFSDDKIKLLQDIEWWNWESSKIYAHLDLLDNFSEKLREI